ncbi:hypothetical protein AB1K70_09275 [Bremerella sp. JC770]|uniref:hypothetical protein n=1 Tax=Bremerella sp. JC770 TaxID=3232137 RepID=UPI003459FBE2
MIIRVTACVLTALFALVTFSGCGGSGLPSVTGMVTIDGQPAPEGLQISFQPDVPNSSTSLGITDASGNYEMKFNPSISGVMAGTSKVRVWVPRKMGAEGIPAIPSQLKGIKIPREFNEDTTLTFEVQNGSNTFDIDIPSK